MGRLKILLVALTLVVIGAGFYFWWQHQTLYPSSDDAYLRANILTVAPQIGGTVSEVLVAENQRVDKDAILFKIDESPLKLAVQQANAELVIAQQNSASAGDNLESANAQLAAAKAALVDASKELARNEKLVQEGVVTKEVLDQLRDRQQNAASQVQAAEANVASASSQAGKDTSQQAGVEAAQAALGLAKVRLGYAVNAAPAAGWIANLSLRPNQVVSAGLPLFSLVEDGEWWVDANFKETDLQRVRPGQPATISIDMYSGAELTGVVESIGAGSGAVFSLLPPENATGNWVKVTQRFPVRIKLADKPADPALQLRVGASVSVTIDTTASAPQ